jgi:hypothetical protein
MKAVEILNASRIAFMGVVWGQGYRHFLCDYCFASMLAPGNVPVLGKQSGARLVIASTSEDWTEILKHPLTRQLSEYLTLELVEIEAPGPGRNSVLHMSAAHKRLFQMCFDKGLVAFNIMPDGVFANGTIGNLARALDAGAQLVLMPAMRAEAEGFFTTLTTRGAMPADAPQADNEQPLNVSAAVLAEAVLGNPHVETVTWMWDSTAFANPSLVLWMSRDGRGAVIRCFEWMLAVIDFAALTHMDIDDFDWATYADGFIDRHFHQAHAIRFMTDSDQAIFATWTTRYDGLRELRHKPGFGIPLLGQVMRATELSRRFYAEHPIKQWAFQHEVIWHADPMPADMWTVKAIADRATRFATVSRPVPANGRTERFPRIMPSRSVSGFIPWLLHSIAKLETGLPRLGFLLGQLLKGDGAAFRILVARVRRLLGRA